MLKKWIALLLLLTMTLAIIPAKADVSEVMCVVRCSEWVSLREQPDQKSKRLKKVALGEQVTKCRDNGDGYIKCTYDGQRGYIQAKYLKVTDLTADDDLMGAQMIIDCSEWVSLRDYPDTTAARLAKLPLGTMLTNCVGAANGFVRCDYGKKQGYVQASYLTKYDPKLLSADSTVYDGSERSGTVLCSASWIPMYKTASRHGKRIAKLPNGAELEDCIEYSDSYIYGRYGTLYGYIPAANVELDAPAGSEEDDSEQGDSGSTFASLPTIPPYSDFTSVGSEVLTMSKDGYSVLVRRATQGMQEEIMAVCYSASLKPVWCVSLTGQESTELTLTDAIPGGTEQDPYLILFSAGQGFFAYDIGPWTDVRWSLESGAALQVSGSICYGKAPDGTLYVAGAYNDAPICIASDGTLRWKAVNTDQSIYWPFRIQATATYVDVYYDSSTGSENTCYVIRYNTSGKRQMVSQRAK